MTPPVFVPYFSAMMVTSTTTSAERTKGMMYDRQRIFMLGGHCFCFLNVSFLSSWKSINTICNTY